MMCMGLRRGIGGVRRDEEGEPREWVDVWFVLLAKAEAGEGRAGRG
jgi:hypothetical protein